MSAIFALWGGKALRAAAGILTVGITIPVWALVAAWLFFQWEESRSVKQALAKFVAGAEIAALEAQIAAQAKLSAFREGQAAEARRLAAETATATAELQAKAIVLEKEKENLTNEIDDLMSRPSPDQCLVTPDLLDRLRKH